MDNNFNEGEGAVTRILFHYAFSDYAGNYLNNGWFIDNQGVVKAYSTGLHQNWSFPNNDIYTGNQLLTNYQLADFTVGEVPVEKLYGMFALLNDFKEGPFSEPKYDDQEEGTEAYYCFDWDPVNNLYQRVLLGQEGDLEQENRNAYARLVVNWMKTIREKVFAKYAMVN